jgi:single-strand DNA-binding protein
MNRITMIGRLSKDITYRVLSNGTELAKSSLAVNDRKTDKTTFIDVTFFNGLAGVVNRYLKKGDKIGVDGRLEQSKYKDKYGNNRYNYEIIVQDLEMLGKSDTPANPKNSWEDYTDNYNNIDIPEDEIPF